MFGNCGFSTSCWSIYKPVVDGCAEVVFKGFLYVWYNPGLILKEVHWSGELFEIKCVLRVGKIDKRGEFPVCILKVEDFMNMEGEVEDKSSFDVEVSVKNLVKKIGSMEGCLWKSDIFSFVNGLYFKCAENESG